MKGARAIPGPQYRSGGRNLASDLRNASDLELVDEARQGSEPAFEEIVHRHSARVFSVASRFFRRRAQVEEVAQEVFLKAYTELGSFEGRGSFEGWLTRIATNLCLNMVRTAKARSEFLVSDLTDSELEWIDRQMAAGSRRIPTAEDAAVAADLAERLLSEMSEEDRLALLMIDGEQLSIKEVIDATGWSESKVKSRTFRARKRMREAVERLLGRKDAN